MAAPLPPLTIETPLVLPLATRTGYREVDAILVASPHEPALDGVKADLHLAWRVARIQLRESGDLVVAGPIGDWANEIAIARAFSCAASRRGRILSVGDTAEWRSAVTTQASRWDGLTVEQSGLGEALDRLRDRPESVDVIVTPNRGILPPDVPRAKPARVQRSPPPQARRPT